MSAFVAFCVHQVRNILRRAFPQSRHNLLIERSPYGLPVPETIHRVITEEELRGRRLVVIGDVHGCYDELVELMKLCNTNDSNICPIFVGDLVWKGPHSAQVVKLLCQLDSFAVRGNADEVAMLSWQRYIEREQDLTEKSEWLLELTNHEMQWLFSLPYSIHIPSRDVIIIHAGLVPGLDLQSQRLSDMLHLRDVTFDSKSLTFSGHIRYHPNGQPWAQAWNGPQHVYFGHDAKRFYQNYPYATGIDLGCVYGGHLAAVFPDEDNRIVKFKALKEYCTTSEKKVESAPPKL